MSLAIKDVNIINPKKVRLYKDNFKKLNMRIGEEQEICDVRPLVAFPLSDPKRFISFHTADGQEVGIISSAEELDPDSKKVLYEELEKVYFIPKITKIFDIEEKYGITKWVVETDRGNRTFDVRRRNDVRILDSGRIIIKDVDSNRYEIPNVNKLDAKSKAILDSEL